jgi:ketosteroid isomerase-like protein
MAVVALGACRESDERAEARMGRESDAFETAISILLVKYEQWEASGLADSVASLYTDNAHVAFAHQPPLYGRAAVRDYLAAFYASGRASLNLRSEDAVANGSLGVEHGTYVYHFTPGPDAPPGLAAMFPDSGSYLAHWHRVDGQWRIAELVVSSMAPPRPNDGVGTAKQSPP